MARQRYNRKKWLKKCAAGRVGAVKMDQDRPIGIFDSGMGGIGVLREAVQLLPNERFIYYGDNLNAPYGVLPEERIRALALDVTDKLMAQQIKALVVACNTATSAAAQAIRQRVQIPVIGMEPALKPAAQMRRGGKILVLATPMTLKLDKFAHLMELYGQEAIRVPCEGLMEFAERGELEGARIDGFLNQLLAPYRRFEVDVAVLGCTHYVFLKKAISRALPGVQLIDGNLGTVRRLRQLLEEACALRTQGPGEVCFQTSGDPEIVLPRMKMLYDLAGRLASGE